MNSNVKIYSNIKLSNTKLTKNYSYLSNGWDDITSSNIKYRTSSNNLSLVPKITNNSSSSISLKKSKYNYKLFSSLLFKFFFTILPLIVVGLILSSDEFNFDFFYFLESFSKLQLNNTYDSLKNLSSNLKEYNNNIAYIESISSNFIGDNWFSNVLSGIFNFFNYLSLSIKTAFSLPKLFISAIIDTISNIMAFLTAFFKVFF